MAGEFLTFAFTLLNLLFASNKKDERKKEQTVEFKQLQSNVSLQLVESALQVCPDNVPEKVEKQFKIETERIKKLQGL